nr:MAG TPA: Morphogenesis protein 1 wall, phi29, hydrolase, infection [Caudoviricetes sp.]
MSKLTILTALVRGGMTPIAACAMGGNMMCESNMTANTAQRGMTTLTDAEYTAAANSGAIDFAHDAVGYGLCQWTYSTRKQRLLEYARSVGTSVGDEDMQVNFCLKELRGEYPALWNYLTSAQDLYGAAARICKEYERPAVNNIADRANAGNALYMQYGSRLDATAAGDAETEEDPSGADSSLSGEAGESAALMPGTVRDGDRTPEAEYLAALLESVGYDVLWDGLRACLIDYQSKTGLDADGICGEKTWSKILNN